MHRQPIRVELVEHGSLKELTGIGRYVRELYRHLAPSILVRLTGSIDPPFADRLTFLRHLPLGIEGHCAGSIVHFTQPLGCLQMLWRPVRPAVATVHDLSLLAWPKERTTFRLLERFLLLVSYLSLKRMDTIIAVSEYSRQTVIHHLKIPPERVVTIYSGNDGAVFRPLGGAAARLRERFQIEFDPRYKHLLYVGSELPRKNLEIIFQSLRRLPPHVRLLKVGPAGGQRFRRRTERLIASMGLGERVLLFDAISDEDLALFYNAADLYICGSHLEGFGHPVVEAMSCGTPVVSSRTSSLPEVAGDAALYVSPHDAAALAESVSSILEDQALREQMVARGLEQSARFSWQRTADQMVEQYAATLNARQRSL